VQIEPCGDVPDDLSSERPYIGDESTSRPPSSTKAPRTSSRGARAVGLEPTSKVCQVPSPTTGTVSPVEGIRRVRMAGP
jgi:hypothetical protein